VLIHAVTGGVGLAALQLARAAGAEVFALASPSKWPLCAALGVEHVLSSRARGFGDEILRRTGGQGVDVVLNSLADELMDESVAALRPGGWFVDVGASHRWDAARLAAARPGARYVQYQLTDFQHADRAGYQEELRALVVDIEAGRLAPLPTRVFPVGDAAAALRLMAQARHVGKIVLRTDPRPAPAVRPDRSYLITGGLGALGLEVAGWLASQGARHIVLAGRSPREAPAVEGVTVEQVDVSRRDDVAALLGRIAAGGPPLAGIFHAAGVLDDGVLASQTPERFARVFAGKVAGAWHLHQLTEHAELDFFVLFASQSGLVGTPGQSSYASANTFLDALAHHRRAAGLAATSIDWGGWSGRGMAADITAHDRDARAALGLGAIAPADGLRAMDRILAGDAAQVAVLPIDWSRFARGLRRVPALLSDLAAAPRAAAPATARRPARRESLDAAGLLEAAREEVARLLGMPPERLDLARPLGELGLDSLMAVELRNRLAERTGVGLPMVAVLRRPSVQAIGEQLASATPARAEPTESKRGSLLVPLGAGAARRFFCVHGVGGGCGHFGELSSALGDSLSFVALRARGLVDGETPLTSVDAMVDAYLAEVRAAQPTGPYFLGGYCIGAIMAVEMARRLTEAGERVGLLALIDAVFLWPSPLEAGVGAAELLGNMALATARWTAAKLRRRDFADPRRYLIHLAQRLRGRPYSAAEAPPPDDATPQQEAVWRATLHAASTHTLRPYHGPILALRAREDRRFMRMLDPKLGLRRIALGGLDIVDVPGDHATLLDPPHVAALAAVLRARS
jgi:thioesterase domain-containing protein/NADPH:quinone reductase-like Zn-dependent oxidoreductase/acyl carrier protein